MAAAPTNSISRKLLAPGIKKLRSYLQSELGALHRTPVLLISSEAGATSKKLKPVADSCRWVQFTLSQQFGVRTVPTTISSAFPTKDSLEQTLELMQRTGASSVVSVGSGAAMDLAKAVQANLDSGSGNDNDDDAKKTPLIMVPTTYGGVLAAGTSHSLFFDGDEETLLPLPESHREILSTSQDAASAHAHAIVSTLDPQKYMEELDNDTFDVLLYAISAVLLDAGLRKSTHPSLPTLLRDTIDLFSSRKTSGSFDTLSVERSGNEDPVASVALLTSTLYQSAGLLSYGLGDGFRVEDDRSIPVALVSSLVPTLFPETHPVHFLAGLVPGLCHCYSEQHETSNDNGPVSDKLETLVDHLREQQQPLSGGSTTGMMRPPPSLVTNDESLQGFSVPDMALSHIQSNQAVWKPADVPNDVFVQVLQHCMQQE